MPIQLKNPQAGFPPGGWAFHDPHTAMAFDDPLMDLNAVCAKVAQHRKANLKIYPPDQPLHFDIAAIRQEIIVQTCSRVPNLCEDSALSALPQPQALTAVAPPPPQTVKKTPRPNGRPCERCGNDDFEEVLCSSCGNRKVNGYKCKKCGFQT